MSAEVIEFILKFTIPFTVIITSLFNLTMEWGNENRWSLLLASSIAYMMKGPELKESIKALMESEKIKNERIHA